jgi:predicted adenylyl cyclase CyaB
VTGARTRLIELKARCADLGAVRQRLAGRATHEQTVRQTDSYFAMLRGRLKLREVDGAPAELIYYDRPDAVVKTSAVDRVSCPDGRALRALLTRALGLTVIVTKSREIWRWEDVQVHLDHVDRLGTFLEFEQPAPPEDDIPGAAARLRRMLHELGLDESDLVPGSYADLLANL